MKTFSFRCLSLVLVLLVVAGVRPVAAQEKVELTFWYWAESDAPGADKWMADTVEAYKKVQPNVTVTVVAQSTDTLIGAFQSAVTAGAGPDIASQWATGPVLSFVWQDALVPVSDYVPADEMKHWLNLNENSYNGKNWGAPMYLIGIDVLYNKDLFKKANVTAPASGRWTWDEFMAACKQLKAAGITPFVVGDKNGYSGAWWFANIGMQALDSTEELRQAVIGKASFNSDKYVSMYKSLDDLVKAGYVNPDVMSLDLDQGIRLFWQGQGAMAFGTDGMAKEATTDLGVDKVGVMKPPKWGNGKLADVGDATQSISFLITKWSAHPKEAAAFLAFLHTPDRLTAWYKATGVVAADDRFDRTLVTSPILKQMAEWETTGPQIWLENYLPAQLDSDADLPAGQTIYAQSGSPADAAALWERTAQTWRSQHPDELKNWQNWKQE
ncbi:MAG TPA: extracellular solute-binding protein [Aggregatilineales bacterium]|nr:extracellular solute-binding protein [Aggregatilineales bacterium]